MNFDISSFAGTGLIFLVLYLLFTGLIVALASWILYSVVWRAVRRGLRESGVGDVRYE